MSCSKTQGGGGGAGGAGGAAGGVIGGAAPQGPHGLITEPAAHLLAPGQHPVFENVTYRGGEIRPVDSDGVVPDPGWPWGTLGQYEAVRLERSQTPGYEYWAYTALAGGAPVYRHQGTLVEEEVLTLAAPTAAPALSSWAGAAGLAEDETRTYRVAWATTLGLETSPGPTVDVTNTAGFGPRAAVIVRPSPPAGAEEWVLWVLQSTTGIWRKVGAAAVGTATLTDANPASALVGLEEYLLPLNRNGDPEVLVDVGSDVQALALHKGCLLTASGSVVRYSESGSHRVFRDWARLDVGGTVLRIVSWEETAYAFTGEGVTAIVGSPPYFEVRRVPKTRGPAARATIVDSDAGVWFLGDDGIYLWDGTGTKSVTAGLNSPWIEQIAVSSTCVAGGTERAYVLVDSTVTPDGDYRALVFDWGRAEFRERRLTTLPAGLRYDPAGQRLVWRTAVDTYWVFEQGSAPMDWEVRYRTLGVGTRAHRLPPWICVDGEGVYLWHLYVDGHEVAEDLVVQAARLRQPRARAHFWYGVLNGRGTAADTVVRAVRHG